MENIITFAGFCQVILCLWVMDWTATVPRMVLGIVVFALLVVAVRQVLKAAKQAPGPAKKRLPRAHDFPRIL